MCTIYQFIHQLMQQKKKYPVAYVNSKLPYAKLAGGATPSTTQKMINTVITVSAQPAVYALSPMQQSLTNRQNVLYVTMCYLTPTIIMT